MEKQILNLFRDNTKKKTNKNKRKYKSKNKNKNLKGGFFKSVSINNKKNLNKYKSIIKKNIKKLNEIVSNRNGKRTSKNDLYKLNGGDLPEYAGFCHNMPSQCNGSVSGRQCGGFESEYCDGQPSQCQIGGKTDYCDGNTSQCQIAGSLKLNCFNTIKEKYSKYSISKNLQEKLQLLCDMEYNKRK